MPPYPGVLDHLIRERQKNLRMTPHQAQAPARTGVRVHVGHALIAAGSSLSGERVRVEHARHSAHPRAAG
jgi:hypothetical protein